MGDSRYTSQTLVVSVAAVGLFAGVTGIAVQIPDLFPAQHIGDIPVAMASSIPPSSLHSFLAVGDQFPMPSSTEIAALADKSQVTIVDIWADW